MASEIKIQPVKKAGKGEFLADQILCLVDEVLGPVLLAFSYYALLWIALILFCWKEMAGILNIILTGNLDWGDLGGCIAKILLCSIAITFIYQRAIKGRE